MLMKYQTNHRNGKGYSYVPPEDTLVLTGLDIQHEYWSYVE